MANQSKWLRRIRLLDEGLGGCDIQCPEELPAEWWLEYEERAAIFEHDGLLAREHAEAKAFFEILHRVNRK